MTTITRMPAALFHHLVLILCAGLILALDAGAASVVQPTDMDAAVSLAIEVADDGTIEGTMRNNTGRKIGDVEVLVEYGWIWARDFAQGDDDPGWSTTYTLPVELLPGASIPVNIAPLHALPDRDDGHFVISAKVVGYTRYRWVTPQDLD